MSKTQSDLHTKTLQRFFFTPKQEIRAFRHYFFSLLLTEKWFLCDMERVALFFLSRFGDNSVTIDGDLIKMFATGQENSCSFFLVEQNLVKTQRCTVCLLPTTFFSSLHFQTRKFGKTKWRTVKALVCVRHRPQ